MLLKNAESVSGGWDGAAQISLFLKQEVDKPKAQKLAQQLRTQKEIGEVNSIDRSSALDEFKKFSGFGDALKALENNPLPNVLIIRPP